jgi:hypothetical protein
MKLPVIVERWAADVDAVYTKQYKVHCPYFPAIIEDGDDPQQAVTRLRARLVSHMRNEHITITTIAIDDNN